MIRQTAEAKELDAARRWYETWWKMKVVDCWLLVGGCCFFVCCIEVGLKGEEVSVFFFEMVFDLDGVMNL